jgi:hypothetical protein
MTKSQLARARARAAYIERDAVAWPGIEDQPGFRKTLWRRAYEFALHGGGWKELIGEQGGLSVVIEARVEQLSAIVKQREAERITQLERTIQSSRTRADEQIEEARAQDRLAEATGERIEALEIELEEIEEDERRLKPGQRSGRLIGKEAATAACATGLADASALLLTINGIGGALWLRLFVAATLALALNVAVMAAARTLAGLWLMVSDSTRGVRVGLATVTLGVLCVLVVGSLLSAGNFRREALLNLDQGLPADPRFLVWIGITAAYSATLALGWWHYSSEGDRLARQRRKVESQRDRFEQAQRRCEDAARDASRQVFQVLVEGKNARSDLDLLPAKTDHLIEEQHAEGKALIGIAKDGFSAGKRRRAEIERLHRRPPTIDREMERAVDKAIEEILQHD